MLSLNLKRVISFSRDRLALYDFDSPCPEDSIYIIS